MAREGRQDRTADELQLASRALYYEVWMLNEMVKCLSTQSPEPGTPRYNALVESFVLHTRNLTEFFYPKPSVRDNTIIARDFLTDWDESIPEWLDEVRIRAHKLLAHLTYDRTIKSKDDSDWNRKQVKQIESHMSALLRSLLSQVSPDRIANELDNCWKTLG